SRWRIAYNGAEPVREQTVEAFVEVFSRFGFEPDAMTPVYGLAEATAVVALPRVGDRPRFESVRRDSIAPGARIELGEDAAARRIASVGFPVTGIELRVADAGGAEVGEGSAGEVQVRGRSVMSGYLEAPAAEQPFTADGWLRTGGQGFRVDG